MMAIIDNAINLGYTIAWGSDVSEDGFSRNGVAIVPDLKKGAEATGTDMARWTGLSKVEKRDKMNEKPMPELAITQEMRQKAYDNWETTDDHGMQIYGIAKDQNGKEYYMVKNSWGDYGKYHGIFYASKAFVAYKTMNFVVNKKAVPKEIAKKLGIK
jgi:aminopeptidase C